MEEKWKNAMTVSFISNRQFLLLLLLFLQLMPFESRSVSSSFYDGVVVTHSDLHVLQAFKHDLIDPKGVLRSWNVNGSDPCSGGWEGIKCVRGEVISIQLPWKGLRGLITRRIGELRSLRKLNLHDNLIHGAIPTSLGFLPNLRGIHLFNNRLSGTIPPSIFDCPMLQSLDLSNNNLTGTIPSSSNSSRLYRVNLSFNHLSGSFPAGLTQSRSLTFLFLQNNNLSGTIPDTWGGSENNTYQIKSLILDHNFISGPIPVSFQKLSLIEQISLSNNLINGSIPEEIGSLSKLKVLDLSHNFLGGNIPVGICNLTSLIQLKLDYNRLENQIPDAMNDLKSLSVLSLKGNQIGGQIPVNLGKLSNLTFLDLSENQLSGEIPSNMDIIPDLIFLNVSYNNLSGSVPPLLSTKFNSSSFRGNLQLCGYSVSTPCLSSPATSMPNLPPTTTSHEPNRQRKRIRDIMLITLGSLLILLFILLLCFLLLCCLVRRRRGTSNPKTRTLDGKSGGTKSSSETGNDTGGKLVHFDGTMMFSADDLLCATAEIMGKSTYGTVYKATFEDGNDVAVKRLREKISKNQKEFEAEVNWLGKIRHPNLLALRAYYLGPKGEKLLVYDYVSKGSLAAFLHARKAEIPMNWTTRMNIIVGISRGLRHLHIKENIIHGNLTSKNVLLDENMNAKISHFGILRLMNTTSVNTHTIAAAGTIGYAAPELAKLKKPTLKSDIYSLGVIMLELLTGRSPNEAMNGTDLPQWVASVVKEEWTNEVFDLELMKDQTTATGDELINTLKLALHCVDPSPASRPEIEHVLQQLEEIRPEFASGSDEQASIEIPGDN